MEYYYQNFWRMDWGFGNPNLTAALIVELFFASWTFAFIFRKKGFWISLFLSGILIPLLFHTYSRGAIAALLAGLMILAIFAPRPWKPIHRKAILLIFIGFALYSFFINATQRYAQGISQEDKSIDHRLMVWKAIPQMIKDAPEGWGHGNAANAYMQWYQPLENQQRFKHLISSHFTWLVEKGWGFRIAYILGWSLAILSCWPTRSWISIPFAIWISFFITSTFSATAHSPYLWIIPILGTLWLLVYYIKKTFTKNHSYPNRKFPWNITVGGSIVIFFMCINTYITLTKSSQVHYEKGIITIGSVAPFMSILSPDTSVIGAFYGKEIRAFINDNPDTSIEIILNSEYFKKISSSSKLLLSGNLEKYKSLSNIDPDREIIILSPVGNPNTNPWFYERNNPSKVIYGEFDQNFDRKLYQNENFALYEIPGNTKYIKKWIF